MEALINSLISTLGLNGVIVGGTLLLEVLMRLMPTKNPKSIFLAVAKACDLLSAGLSAISVYLNKIVPQNLK